MARITHWSVEWRRHLRFLAAYLIGVVLMATVQADFPGSGFQPVGFRLEGRAALLEIDQGTRRVRLQVDEGKGSGWQTHTITHLDGRAGHLKLRIPDSVPINALRIEASNSDPFPSSLYSGKTTFSETADEQNSEANRGMVNEMFAAEDGDLAAAEGGEVTVEESDIWKWRERTLYFFNQQRGLQVFSLEDLDSPKRMAQLRMPAAGEQIYLVGGEHVVLLANRVNAFRRGGSSAGSEVVLVRHRADQLSIEQRYPLEGSFVESRMVGDRLYAVTRIWENILHADGMWRTRAGMKVYAFDFTDPSNPVEQQLLNLTGEDSYYYNAVVTATPDRLFVIPSVYDPETRRTVSWVHVIGIDDPAEPMKVSRRIPLGGQLHDKFKLAVRGGILTTVSQVWNSAAQGRHTLVETHDLRRAPDQPARLLDSLVLAPGETVRATRFDEDRLYVVTFRQIDPLFAIDLSRPRRLKVLGHIDIPGWSTYMEIFGDLGRILSVGVEGSRVAVSLFDVADPQAMSLAKRVYLGDEDAHSWSEGNYDEKAVGFFPGDGLLALPFSGRVEGVYRKQMQIMDIGDDTLIKRGVIDSAFSARRGKLLEGDKLVVISGQQLRVVDIANRDAPAVGAELSIAWSVERVLSVGSHMVQLEGGYSNWWSPDDGLPTILRLTSASDPDTLVSELKIAAGDQLVGASVQGELVHLATSRTDVTAIEQEDGSTRWEYAAFFSTHTVDVSDPAAPLLAGSAELKIADYSVYLGAMNAQVLPGGELLWFPESSGTGNFPCMMCVDIAEDVAFGRPAFGPSGNGDGWLIVTEINESAEPRILSATRLIDKDGHPGNRVETGPVFVSGSLALFGFHLSNWSSGRHNGRYLLRQIDFSDPLQPILRKDVNVPGLLKHINTTATGGTVLFTTRQKIELKNDGLAMWSPDLVLEVSIFDGINAFLVDSAEVEDAFYSPLTGHGRFVLIPLNGGNRWWGIPEDIKQEHSLRVFAWSDADDGIESLPDIAMQGPFAGIAVVEDMLFAFDYGAVEVLALTDLPDTPRSEAFGVATGYSYPRGSAIEFSAKTATAWIATGSYGVEALDLSFLTDGEAAEAPGGEPKDQAQEWWTVEIDPMQLVVAEAADFVGSLPVGYSWRFQPLATQENYADWSERHFNPGAEHGFPVPSAEADSDGDGVANLMEFYMGTRPDDPVSVAYPLVYLVEDETGCKYLVLNVAPNPSAGGMTVHAEISNDLVDWRDAADAVQWQQHGSVSSLRVISTVDSSLSVYLRLKVGIEPVE